MAEVLSVVRLPGAIVAREVEEDGMVFSETLKDGSWVRPGPSLDEILGDGIPLSAEEIAALPA